jgi:hypothetical protein
MSFAEVRKNQEHGGPNTNEECDYEECNLPLGNVYAPQERPITSIWLERLINMEKIETLH